LSGIAEHGRTGRSNAETLAPRASRQKEIACQYFVDSIACCWLGWLIPTLERGNVQNASRTWLRGNSQRPLFWNDAFRGNATGCGCTRSSSWIVILGSLAFLAAGAALFANLKTSYFPDDVQHWSYIDVRLPNSVNSDVVPFLFIIELRTITHFRHAVFGSLASH
jgi:hypothetical protein